VDVNKRLIGGALTGLAVAAFLGALVTFLVFDATSFLWYAIGIEAITLIGLVALYVWPEPDFEAEGVNPDLVRCPRCDSVFDPPRRSDTIECPTCGLSGATQETGPAHTERAKEDALS
jgi:hypothetical protein